MKINKLTQILIAVTCLAVLAYYGILIFDKLKPKTKPVQVNIVEDTTTQPITEKKLTVNELVELNSKYIVTVYCAAKDGDVTASGVVIGRDKDYNLIVLTNNHVIENLKTYKSGLPPCSVKVEGEKGVEGNEFYYAKPYFPEEISIKDMELIDFAFLTIKSEPKIKSVQRAEDGTETETDQPITYLSLNTFPTICSEDQLKIGEDLVVLGFPDVSGIDIPSLGSMAKFTATEGIISEKVNFSGYYFNTSAKIEYGNSGGGAFLMNSGCLAGLPTFVRAGELESMGRILNANKLQNEFLNKINMSKAKSLYEYLNEAKKNN